MGYTPGVGRARRVFNPYEFPKNNRRRHLRFELCKPVSLEYGTPKGPEKTLARVLDVSEAGMRVETPCELIRHRMVSIGVPDDMMFHYVQARVVRCSAVDEGRWDVGLDFDPASLAASAFPAVVLEQLAARIDSED